MVRARAERRAVADVSPVPARSIRTRRDLCGGRLLIPIPGGWRERWGVDRASRETPISVAADWRAFELSRRPYPRLRVRAPGGRCADPLSQHAETRWLPSSLFGRGGGVADLEKRSALARHAIDARLRYVWNFASRSTRGAAVPRSRRSVRVGTRRLPAVGPPFFAPASSSPANIERAVGAFGRLPDARWAAADARSFGAVDEAYRRSKILGVPLPRAGGNPVLPKMRSCATTLASRARCADRSAALLAERLLLARFC